MSRRGRIKLRSTSPVPIAWMSPSWRKALTIPFDEVRIVPSQRLQLADPWLGVFRDVHSRISAAPFPACSGR